MKILYIFILKTFFLNVYHGGHVEIQIATTICNGNITYFIINFLLCQYDGSSYRLLNFQKMLYLYIMYI